MTIKPSNDWQICSCEDINALPSVRQLLGTAAVDSLGHSDLLAVLLCLLQAALAGVLQPSCCASCCTSGSSPYNLAHYLCDGDAAGAAGF